MRRLFLLLTTSLSLVAFGQSIELKSNSRNTLGLDELLTASISAGDVDGDGDMDIVVANGRHWPQYNQVFINNGKGSFTVSKWLGKIAETSYATELADFDADGDLDIAVGNDMAPNSLLFNDGDGNFTNGESFGMTYSPTRNL
ncbi:MAG: FG-GAP repeat domain-containing protein, partial [Cyclobacteriaceae bacterium]